MLGCSGSDATKGVFTNFLLKEVGLALQQDHLHPFKGVGDIEQFGLAQVHQEVISGGAYHIVGVKCPDLPVAEGGNKQR